MSSTSTDARALLSKFFPCISEETIKELERRRILHLAEHQWRLGDNNNGSTRRFGPKKWQRADNSGSDSSLQGALGIDETFVSIVDTMAKEIEIKWLSKPEDQDYSAAVSYLSLLYDEPTSTAHVEKIKRATVCKFKAKDIFRASGLSLLGVSNSHVKRDRKKIKTGKALSPILLLRNTANGKVIIADGYHRLCAVYSYHEDAVIPCKIA